MIYHEKLKRKQMLEKAIGEKDGQENFTDDNLSSQYLDNTFDQIPGGQKKKWEDFRIMNEAEETKKQLAEKLVNTELEQNMNSHKLSEVTFKDSQSYR